MPADPAALDQMVTALVPSLSKSLAERFNVFRVMHHGTHEKQLSNVFAWLLREDATHHLGDLFQRIFVGQANRALAETDRLPLTGYRVLQEVDTSGAEAAGKDIADMVLVSEHAAIVVENFETSDGHGHDYQGYLQYGSVGEKQSVVVLLCARRETQRLSHGWEHATVITYGELLQQLEEHVDADPGWRRTNAAQHFFLNQLIDHFVEGTDAMSTDDQIAFIKTMCETEESARYGLRPQEVAATEFAELLADHAKRQFEDSRALLGEVKRSLRRHAERRLVPALESALGEAGTMNVHARFVGQWEFCVTVDRGDAHPHVYLEFGPTAVVENKRAPRPIELPDFGKVFVTRHARVGGGVDEILQTDVGIDEVLAGLPEGDARLLDAVLEIIERG